MGKHSVKSITVNCPICGKECQTRGLHSHLRLMHPNSDIKKELRKKIMSRNANNDKVIFQVSIDINDNWKVKWANFTMEDVEFLQEMFTQWVDEGHIMNVSGFDEHLFVDETSGADPEWTD
jgi:hypothetical protein